MANGSGLFVMGRPTYFRALTLILIAMPFPAPGKELAAVDGVFGPGKLWQVHLVLSADEYSAMQPRAGGGFPGFGPPLKAPEEPVDPQRDVHRSTFGTDLPWATGAASVGDETFQNVGIRYKGNGTIVDAARTIKKSFKIDLDRFGGTGRFGGSKTINLHCGVTDPSKCREILGYELYRAAGVAAPQTALAEVRLSVPGKHDKELLGVYTIVEEVDKPFLRRHFGGDAGLLMKPEGVRDFDDWGDDWERYKGPYAPKRAAKKGEASRIMAFARLIHKADDATFAREIGTYLDVDQYLRFLAVTSFIANTDSLFVGGHNYYLYLQPESRKLSFIPWDLDRAFANFPFVAPNRQQMQLSLTHPYAGNHRLTERLLGTPEVRAQYQRLWKELSATVFDKESLLQRLESIEAAARELLDRDAEAAAARNEGEGSSGPPAAFGKPPRLRTFIEKRTASVAAQLAGTSQGYVPAGFGAGGPPKIGAMLAGPLRENFDRNDDEQLAREEWLSIAKKVFSACEQDDEQQVDVKFLAAGLDSLFPPPPAGAPPGGFTLGGILAGPILARADGNKDTRLTAEELLAAAGDVFDEHDKAQAGQLDDETFEELLNGLFPPPAFGPVPGAPPRGGK